MAIWGFFGSLGSGKDITANYFISLKRAKGKQVVTHCQVNYPHIFLSIDDIFQKAINDTLFFEDKVLYISEFHLIVDARRSSASVNVDFSQMLLIQLSKINCDLVYSCQLLSQVDLRIKQMQKYFFLCNKEFRLNGLSIEEYNKIDFDRRIIKLSNGELLPFDIKLQLIEQDGQKIKVSNHVLPWETLQQMFKLYDTKEIVKFDRKKYLK